MSWNKGRKHTPEELEKMRLSQLGKKFSQERKLNISLSKKGVHTNVGESNPMWKGDNVSYAALHMYVSKRLPKPDLCPICNKRKPYDLANKGEYNRDLNNWAWLCRKCHMHSDGRNILVLNNLKQFNQAETFLSFIDNTVTPVY